MSKDTTIFYFSLNPDNTITMTNKKWLLSAEVKKKMYSKICFYFLKTLYSLKKTILTFGGDFKKHLSQLKVVNMSF